MERVIKSGTGWRIGWNPDAPEFKGLVGTQDWAIELTEAELNEFCRLFNQLADTMKHLATELMEEEKNPQALKLLLTTYKEHKALEKDLLKLMGTVIFKTNN